MNAYPAMRATQGSQEYFVVKMYTKELAKDIGLAYEVHGGKVPDEKIHHNLSQEKLQQKAIVHLAQSEIHIPDSIVVISIGGDPEFRSVLIEDNPEFKLIGREDFNDTFGMLSFNGKQKYYVIGGQKEHSAIKILLNRKNRSFPSVSGEFKNEEIPVIMIVFRDKDGNSLERYKQVHSNINKLDALAQVVDEFFQLSDRPSMSTGADEETPDINLVRDRKS